MIKANVISGYSNWKKIIKKPNDYFKQRLKILSNKPLFLKKNHEFSILLTNDKKMKFLNFKFRKKNIHTDVLSFPLRLIEKKNVYIGDIAISFEIINRRSKTSNFFLELDKMWIHGYFHLIGYDHKKIKDFEKMKKKENLVINYFYKKN